MTSAHLTAEQLLGTWQLVRCDAPLEIQPNTQMQFERGSVLTYVIPTPNGTLRMALTWQLEGGTLHTVNDDGSHRAAVGATLGPAEVLVFDFGGPRAFFVRST